MNRKLHFVFFGAPYIGHSGVTTYLVKALVEKGNKVTYFNTKKFKDIIEESGANFIEYSNNKHEVGFIAERTRLLIKKRHEQFIEEALEIIPFVLATFPKDCFDAVIYDQCSALWGQPIAEHYKIPSFCSNTMFYFTSNCIIKNMPTLVPLVDQQYNNKLKEFRKYYNLNSYKDVVGLNCCSKANYIIAYISEYLQPNSEKIAKREVIFLGNRFNGNNFKPINKKINNNSIIYISLGTIFNTNYKLIKHIIEAFREKPYKIVVSSGNNDNVLQALKKDVYKNTLLFKFVNQLDILEKSSLFVTHGGMNSIYEGLYYGVPLLMVPQTDEQRINATRVKELGAGYLLDIKPKSNVKELLNEATNQIKSNWENYIININNIRRSFFESSNPRSVADKMQDIVNKWKLEK